MTPLTARMVGIVRSPRATFTELAASPRSPWADVLLASTCVMFLALAALLMTTVGQTALVDQWERTLTAFGMTVDDTLYSRLREWSAYGFVYAALMAIAQGPLLALALTGVIVVLLRVRGTSPAAFGSVLPLVSHASLILALRQVVTAPLNYIGETLASPTTLVQLVPAMDEASPLARFLGVVDLFVVWWAIVLAMGVAALAHRRVRSLALTFTGVYVAVALVLALAMAATGGTA